MRIVGEIVGRPDPLDDRAEFAIVVSADHQQLGLGRVLLEKLIDCARARNMSLLYGLVARANTPMLALGRRLGFEIDDVPDVGTAVLSLDLRPALPTAR